MNLRALRTLIEIDRAGSFALAADQLGLTLSAVSVQMKTLEAELGFALFDRTRRPPALTPDGRLAATRARAALREVESIRGIADASGALRGTFRIGFVGTASVRLMPGFLARAAEAYPEARILVASGLSESLIERVRAGELDAAVVTETEEAGQDLRLLPLRTERFALASPARAAGWTLAACAEALPFIQFRPSSGIGVLVDDYLSRVVGDLSKAIVLDSVESVMGCVNAGLGFAIAPEPDARRYAVEAAVSPLEDPPLTRRLALATPARAVRSRPAEAFAALLRA